MYVRTYIHTQNKNPWLPSSFSFWAHTSSNTIFFSPRQLFCQGAPEWFWQSRRKLIFSYHLEAVYWETRSRVIKDQSSVLDYNMRSPPKHYSWNANSERNKFTFKIFSQEMLTFSLYRAPVSSEYLLLLSYCIPLMSVTLKQPLLSWNFWLLSRSSLCPHL